MPVFRRVFSDAAAQLSRRIASAARSDCVRRPIRLRSPSDQIAFGVRSDCVRCPTTRRELLAVGGYGILAVAIAIVIANSRSHCQ